MSCYVEKYFFDLMDGWTDGLIDRLIDWLTFISISICFVQKYNITGNRNDT